MTEKYSNWGRYYIAYLYRLLIRGLIAGVVRWSKVTDLQEGCTVIIGMCSKLPHVLRANLSCLRLAQWPELKKVVIAVDCPKNEAIAGLADQIAGEFKDLNIQFVYYSSIQFFVAELLKLPYVFSWLSWCLAIRETKTKCFFIHDYDALLLGDILKTRYQHFMQSRRVIEGVLLYRTNGFIVEDKMVCTFEAFVNTKWVRDRKPIELFNQIGIVNGRRVDFDTLLEMQIKYSSPDQREVIEMTEDELIHPAQMIHQYTVFRKFPARPWNCAALVMLPFFYYLSGQTDAITIACNKLRHRSGYNVELLADGCVFNFNYLTHNHLEKMLYLMIQGFIKLGREPFKGFREYGNAFYDLVKVPMDQRWQMARNKDQKKWIDQLLSLELDLPPVASRPVN